MNNLNSLHNASRTAIFDSAKGSDPTVARLMQEELIAAQQNELLIFTTIHKNKIEETYSAVDQVLIAIGGLFTKQLHSGELTQKQIHQLRLRDNLSSKKACGYQRDFPAYIVRNELNRLSYTTALSFKENPNTRHILTKDLPLSKNISLALKNRSFLLSGGGEKTYLAVWKKTKEQATTELEQEKFLGVLTVITIATLTAEVVNAVWKATQPKN